MRVYLNLNLQSSSAEPPLRRSTSVIDLNAASLILWHDVNAKHQVPENRESSTMFA